MNDNENNKNNSPRIAIKNIALLIIMRVVMPLLSITLILAISRIMGAEGLGRYTLAYSFLLVFNSIGPLGLNAVITREGARNHAALSSTLSHAMTACVSTACVLTIVMLALAVTLDYDRDTTSALITLSLAVIPCTIGVLLDGAAMAIERVDQIAKGVIVEYIFKLGAGLSLLFLGYGLEAVLFMAVIGKSLACLVQSTLLGRADVNVGWSKDSHEIRKLLELVPTFLGISIFSTLYWRIDVFMLSQLKPVEDVGYYGSAYRILELAMILPQSLCLSLYPRIAVAAQNNLSTLKMIGKYALRYLTVISLPLAVCTALLAKPVLTMLYGKPFYVAATTLVVLIFTLVPYSLVRYHAYVLVSANRQHIDLKLNILMSVINVILNLILIPRYSYFGAAIATFLAISIYATLQYVYLRRYLFDHIAGIPLNPPILIVTVLTAGCVWLLQEQPMAISITAGCLVYVGSLLSSGFFSSEELRLLGVEDVISKLRRICTIK